MTDSARFTIRFWGVRGSIACPGPETLRYGGNTSCLEVMCGDRRLIFDAGTGLRPLGNALFGNGAAVDGDIFLSHTHFDHICGMPFFRPFFSKENSFRVWAGHLIPERTLKKVLDDMMTAPLFPVPPEIFSATMDYRDFSAGDTLEPLPELSIRTAPLNHPDRATGYRIEFGGRSLCYITDVSHTEGVRDETLVEFVAGADMVIYDATYTDAEFPACCDYGHSTWQEGVRIVEAANAGRLVIFHHDPSHDDNFMDTVATDAEAMRPGTLVAREGMVLEP